MNFLYFHISTDYIFTLDFTLGATHFHTLVCTSISGIVVELSPIRSLVADCPLSKHLGFTHMPYNKFFLLSQPSRLDIFHSYVVVLLPLGVSSYSGSFEHNAQTYIFLYMPTIIRIKLRIANHTNKLSYSQYSDREPFPVCSWSGT